MNYKTIVVQVSLQFLEASGRASKGTMILLEVYRTN